MSNMPGWMQGAEPLPTPEAPKKKPLWQRPLGWVLGIVGLCVFCGVCSMIYSSTPQGQAILASANSTSTARAQAEATSAQATADAPTATPAPPTSTPEPGAEPTSAPEAPTEAPPTEAAPATLATIGQAVDGNGYLLTVNGVERMDTLSGVFTADEGKVYVVADVTIEATQADVPYNFFYFGLKDSEAFTYDPAIGADPDIGSGTLPAGDRARGLVAFEVPEGATGLVLHYEPIVILGGYEAVRVDLGQ